MYFQALKRSTRLLAIRYGLDALMLKLQTDTPAQLQQYFEEKQKENPQLPVLFNNDRRSWARAIKQCNISYRNLTILGLYDRAYIEPLSHPFWFVLDNIDNDSIDIHHPTLQKYQNVRGSILRRVFDDRLIVYSSYFYHIDKHQNLDSLTTLLVKIKNNSFVRTQYASRYEAIKAQIISMTLSRPFKVIGMDIYKLVSEQVDHTHQEYDIFSDMRARIRPFYALSFRYHYQPRFKLNETFNNTVKKLELLLTATNNHQLLKGQYISPRLLAFYSLRSELAPLMEGFKQDKQTIEEIIELIKKERKNAYSNRKI